jgi:PAS domain S-box-containing protein
MESKYRELLEAAPDAMVVTNERGKIVLLNAQAEKQFGYHRGELIGQEVTNIIPEGFAERLFADGIRTTEEALAQQIDTGIELSARRRDGSEFPIEIMLSPLRSDEGIFVTAAIRNISARKAAEEHLARAEAKYRGLLEAAPDAMVVVNERGEIVLLNVQAEKQFGYPRDELIGQKVTNIIPEGFAERLSADGIRTADEALAQQIDTGIELSARRRDGSEFPIEIMLSPLRSDEGIFVTAAIRNISARKAAEERLARAEAKYRGLLEAAPDAMVVVNERGEIVLLNVQAEKQFGYPRDELIGQKVTNIIPKGFAERLIADGARTADEALAQQIGMGIELSARRKDGSDFPIEIMLSPLRSAEGVLVTAAIRDISLRKEARDLRRHVEALERSNKDLEDFAHIASHDLKEPLRGIANHARFLLEDYRERLPQEGVNRLLRLGYLSRRMEELINDLLYFSRLGHQELAIQSTDLNAVIGDINAMSEMTLRERNATIVIPRELPRMLCDKTRITEVFRNLIINAIKYNDNAIKRVEIGYCDEARRNDGVERNVFYVKDNGIGIDVEFHEEIFRIFKRLNDEDEDKKGTGIGLTLVRKIVERHGGRIWLKSAPAEGATFYFTIDQGMDHETGPEPAHHSAR